MGRRSRATLYAAVRRMPAPGGRRGPRLPASGARTSASRTPRRNSSPGCCCAAEHIRAQGPKSQRLASKCSGTVYRCGTMIPDSRHYHRAGTGVLGLVEALQTRGGPSILRVHGRAADHAGTTVHVALQADRGMCFSGYQHQLQLIRIPMSPPSRLLAPNGSLLRVSRWHNLSSRSPDFRLDF